MSILRRKIDPRGEPWAVEQSRLPYTHHYGWRREAGEITSTGSVFWTDLADQTIQRMITRREAAEVADLERQRNAAAHGRFCGGLSGGKCFCSL